MRRGVMTFLITVIALTVTSSTAPGIAGDRTYAAKKAPSPIPSPKPKWPPTGFKGNDGVYAKVPSTKELIGLLSAKRTLQSVVKQCQEFACGAVIVAAEKGCVWWEVNSSVFQIQADLSKVKIGSLITYATGSEKKEQKTIFLISRANVETGISVSGIKVLCHRSTSDLQKPGNIYNPISVPSESPTS